MAKEKGGTIEVKGREVVQRKVQYRWKSPQRFFKKINRKKFLVVLALVIGFMVILAIIGQYWLMAAIGALMFLIYATGTVSPVKVEHIITNQGVETDNRKYFWEDLRTFWFSVRDDQMAVYVETRMSFPGRLIMLVGRDQMGPVHKEISKFLPYLDKRGQNRLGKITDGTWVNMLQEDEDGGKEKDGSKGKPVEGSKSKSEVK